MVKTSCLRTHTPNPTYPYTGVFQRDQIGRPEPHEVSPFARPISRSPTVPLRRIDGAGEGLVTDRAGVHEDRWPGEHVVTDVGLLGVTVISDGQR